jgi:hypothetical protein
MDELWDVKLRYLKEAVASASGGFYFGRINLEREWIELHN